MVALDLEEHRHVRDTWRKGIAASRERGKEVTELRHATNQWKTAFFVWGKLPVEWLGCRNRVGFSVFFSCRTGKKFLK